MHIVEEPLALEMPANTDGLGGAVALSGELETVIQDSTADSEPGRESVGRLRRSIDRLRGGRDGYHGDTPMDGYVELELDVVLLREENARLKSERHRPPDLGTLIDQLRHLTAQTAGVETTDDAWSVLGECLVLREGLAQVCIEVEVVIGVVQERLAITLDDITLDSVSGADAA